MDSRKKEDKYKEPVKDIPRGKFTEFGAESQSTSGGNLQRENGTGTRVHAKA